LGGNSTASLSGGVMYGCEKRLAIALWSLPANHSTPHLVMRSLQ
jgi:hypothetical protein